MITFLSIQTFRSRLQSLLAYKRGVYAGVDREIITAFSTAPRNSNLELRPS